MFKQILLLLLISVGPIYGSGETPHMTHQSGDQHHHDQKQLHQVEANTSILKQRDIRVYVQGMVCSFCAQGVEKSFMGHGSIKAVDVQLDDQLVDLELKDSATISEDEIRRLVEDSGYNLLKVERDVTP